MVVAGCGLTRDELRELIAHGESSGVEFKRCGISHFQLARELVALANFQGGALLLGVGDDRSVVGLERFAEGAGEGYRKLEEWVMQACRDKVRPEINPHFEVVRGVDGGDVAVLRVERGLNVHCVWHNNHRSCFVRVGTTNREASPEELARLFAQRRAIRLEVQPVSGTSIHDLDARRVVDYFRRVRGQETPAAPGGGGPEWGEFAGAWERLLANTELLNDGGLNGGPFGGGKAGRAATLAGLVLFGRNPTRHLPQAKIDAVAYKGAEKDYDALERRTLRGAIVPLGGVVPDEMVEPGLVEQAIQFVRRNIVTERLDDGIRRVERWDYPQEAVREAVVNAIVHRDYLLSGTDIELSVYSDRLEVVSPGRLPNGITTERMLAGCRSARNELLKDVMRDYGYLEHMGMGVPRKIVRGMREHNGTEPGFVEGEERLTVQLWK